MLLSASAPLDMNVTFTLFTLEVVKGTIPLFMGRGVMSLDSGFDMGGLKKNAVLTKPMKIWPKRERHGPRRILFRRTEDY